jgi:hypothetical protein
MNIKEVWEVAAAVIASLGGGGAIVFALSGYLGKVWADRGLAKQKQEYAQLNIAFNHQLELATRRLQIELDAQGLMQKLRIEAEFEKTKELWRRIVVLRDAFRSIPKSGLALVNPDKEKQHQYHLQSSAQFVEKFHDAYDFWSKEALSVPESISELCSELLKVAQEEVMQAIQYPDPFDGQALALFGSDGQAKWFDNRASNIRVFTVLSKQLERTMRAYVQGGGKDAASPSEQKAKE